MFYGDILLPGQAGGGGLTTFLNTLGNNLAGLENWDSIYTLVLLHPDQQRHHGTLYRKAGEAHYVVAAPVAFPSTDFPQHFAAHEYEIMRSVRRTLERHSIHPHLFHLRYSDNASSSVIALAQNLGKRTVFTLTPDPHRNFTEKDGSLCTLPEHAAMRDMNKVFVADCIVENVDGIVLIGHRNKNNQILPYFPQLWLDSAIRNKPLKILAEGVRSSFSYLHGTRPHTYMDLLLHHGGRHRLTEESLGSPLMLNVGRLDPMKGQRHLFDAWASGSINSRYCLVLIGGNFSTPDPVESELIEHIDRRMDNNSHLGGRFCHIPALPNPEVRLLEQSIIDTMQPALPHMYVCSSYKEEFGISILEAMASGYLVVAPQNGGVSSYLTHGKTGFLINTESSESIMAGLQHVIDPAFHSADELREIAGRGREMVKKTFNIDVIAGDYSAYYQSLIEV
jgi:sucrose-phosphate synthase